LRTITRLAAVAAISSGVLVGAPLAAQADTPGCVTRAEFHRVHRGMTPRRVHRIFGARAHSLARAHGLNYLWYDRCQGDSVWVAYRIHSPRHGMADKYWASSFN
jgi:hypothetical protein